VLPRAVEEAWHVPFVRTLRLLALILSVGMVSGCFGGSDDPVFAPREGWTIVTTSPSEAADGYGPLAWATNTQLPRDSGPFGLSGSARARLSDLPSDGIAMVAWLGGERSGPSDPRRSFPRLTLPLRLPDAAVHPGWEGQPSTDIPMYVLVGWIREEFVEVRIYFGTQNPSDAVLSEAQVQLATLAVPEGR
jgi:hypothetical protein